MEIKGMSEGEQTIVNKLLDIMKEQNMKEQAQNMEEVLRCIVGMQVQLAMATNELHGMKEQLNAMQQNMQPKTEKIKEHIARSVQQLEGKVSKMSAKVSDTKTHFVETAGKAVNAFKEKGRQAMGKVLLKGISGIKTRLTGCREQMTAVMNAYETTAAQIDNIGNELKQAGNSFANIGRILSGKETKEADISEQQPGVALTRMFNKPVKQKIEGKKLSISRIDSAIEKLNKISRSLETALGSAKEGTKPEKEEKNGEEKESRESVKEKLSQMQEKVKDQKEQTEPQKEKKQEACL